MKAGLAAAGRARRGRPASDAPSATNETKTSSFTLCLINPSGLEDIRDRPREAVAPVALERQEAATELLFEFFGEARDGRRSAVEEVVELEDHSGRRRDVQAQGRARAVEEEVLERPVEPHALEAHDRRDVAALVEVAHDEARAELVSALEVEAVLPRRRRGQELGQRFGAPLVRGVEDRRGRAAARNPPPRQARATVLAIEDESAAPI